MNYPSRLYIFLDLKTTAWSNFGTWARNSRKIHPMRMEHFDSMNTSDVFFYLLLSSFVAHEMDAVRCKEWRLLFGFRNLQEKTAETLFIWAHIPLAFFIIFLYGF